MSGFPSSGGTKAVDLDTAWIAIRARSAGVKQAASTLNTLSAAQNTGADFILQYLTNLADARDAMAIWAATPGLGAFAQAQVNDNTVDIVALYNAMVAQIDATRTWIKTNFPKDGSGNLLYQTLDANGRMVNLQFTPAQLAGLRTVLVALIATID